MTSIFSTTYYRCWIKHWRAINASRVYIILVISTNNKCKHTLDPIWLMHTCIHIYTWIIKTLSCVGHKLICSIKVHEEKGSKLKSADKHNRDISCRANSIIVNPEATAARRMDINKLCVDMYNYSDSASIIAKGALTSSCHSRDGSIFNKIACI